MVEFGRHVCLRSICRKACKFDTYLGYGKGVLEKINWPSVYEIKKIVGEKGWVNTGKQLGVSDNAIRKHLIKNGVNIREWKSW